MTQLIPLKRLFFKILKRNPAQMPMVQYWKTGEAAQAKVTTLNGRQVMHIEGEKYIFPGFPRGWLLYGGLSKLKHEIKNQIFNDSWKRLDEGKPIAEYVRSVLPNIYEVFEGMKMDIVPYNKMAIPVQEFTKAWRGANPDSKLNEIITFILQEDDAYRWRFQWMVSYFGFGTPKQKLKRGLEWLEHAEIIGDMKERIRLVRRVILELLKDKENEKIFNEFFKRVNWRKMKLTEAEKYYFRGKYFKVDLDFFDY